MTALRCSVLLVLLVLALLVSPAVASADERFAPDNGGVSDVITAEDGRFVFVGSKGGGPDELLEGYGEDAVSLGFSEANNARIMDAHLGTDAAREAVLTFTYCPERGACAMYRYDFDTRRRVRLAVSRRGCDPSGARMLGGVLYFASDCGARPDGIFSWRPGRAPRRLLSFVPASWDFSRGLLVYHDGRILRRGNDDGLDELGINEVRLKRVGRRGSRRIASGRYNANPKLGDLFGGVYFDDVKFDQGFVYWARTDSEADGDTRRVDLVRAPIARPSAARRLSREGRDLPDDEPFNFPAFFFAVDGDDIYYYGVPSGTRGAISKVGPGRPLFD